ALEISKPDEVYHLGALSHVGVSFEQPELTAQITGLGALRLLEATRAVRPDARFYQASSSEMFGNAATPTQDESTPFRPVSPYGAAKEFAHRVATMYREAYGMHVSCGILFNHEGPRRGPEFVTRKITVAAARIRAGTQTELVLGDLEARRDFGWAPDYVVAMTLMARRDRPGDFVVATGASRSVREFAERAFDRVGLDWRRYVRSDASLLRPTEVATLRGDASRARRELGWAPTRSFEEIVDLMVDADAARTAKETRA
ncbi:MAG TPA: GDP-mannose 4,6-dehydratase, partial [Planctomycetota bacterium]|nr:GDP-mannose 4,6-dehydratase [Planctomycetota bacterium]